MASPNPRKRKLASHSLAFKVKVLEEVDEKILTKTAICKKHGIANSTLSTFIKDRAKIENAFVSSTFQPDRKRMRTCTDEHQQIETVLLRWFKGKHQNVPVDGPVFYTKAVAIAEEIGFPDFQPNPSWLQRFKKRNGIVFNKVSGEAGSVSEKTVEDWKSKTLPHILKDYQPSDIFNADETGLFYRCLPNKTHVFKGETCTGGKQSKERVTLLLCANMDGSERLTPLIIGKSQKPRCFKNVKSLPVEYRANRKAWMTGDLFEEWLRLQNQKFRLQNRKICLFIDNCPAHPTLHLSNIRLVFFPPNCTSRLQPLDQGIIATFKQYYRKMVLQKLIIAMDSQTVSSECTDITQYFKFSLLDALCVTRTAWGFCTQTTIANCFRHAGFTLDAPSSACAESDTETAAEHTTVAGYTDVFKRAAAVLPDKVCSAEEFVSFDSEVQTTAELTTADIVADIKASQEEEEEDEKEEEEGDREEDLQPLPIPS